VPKAAAVEVALVLAMGSLRAAVTRRRAAAAVEVALQLPE
jgi:hypothetical protein